MIVAVVNRMESILYAHVPLPSGGRRVAFRLDEGRDRHLRRWQAAEGAGAKVRRNASARSHTASLKLRSGRRADARRVEIGQPHPGRGESIEARRQRNARRSGARCLFVQRVGLRTPNASHVEAVRAQVTPAPVVHEEHYEIRQRHSSSGTTRSQKSDRGKQKCNIIRPGGNETVNQTKTTYYQK